MANPRKTKKLIASLKQPSLPKMDTKMTATEEDEEEEELDKDGRPVKRRRQKKDFPRATMPTPVTGVN